MKIKSFLLSFFSFALLGRYIFSGRKCTVLHLVDFHLKIIRFSLAPYSTLTEGTAKEVRRNSKGSGKEMLTTPTQDKD